jgi:uncharacterized protein YcbX
MSSSVTVAALYRYPLKSARGIAVTSLEFDVRGPIGDRRWMLIDATGGFLSQRRFPRMALLRPTLRQEKLVVEAPGMSALEVDADDSPKPDGVLAARLWRDHLKVRRVGEDADRWFTDFLGVPCSLVMMPDDTHRQVDLEYAPAGRTVAFADGFPVLVIGSASLEELNRRLHAKGHPALGMDRFRPNVVLSGGAPHEEDTWKRLVGPGVSLDLVKPCARCVITTVDQDRAIRGREPLATLSEYRQRDRGVLFGQNALHDRPGHLRVGEPMRPEIS